MKQVLNDCKEMENIDGLTITKKETTLSPTIYLNAYFQQYEDGMKIEEITTEICRDYYINFKNMPEGITSNLMDFGAVQDRLVYKLIRRQRNELLLSDIPSTPYLDLEIVYYLLISKDEDGQITTEEIHKLAMANTERLLPATIIPIEEVLYGIIRDSAKDEDELLRHCIDVDTGQRLEHPLFVFGNTTGQNGAAVILYAEVLDKFSNEVVADIIIIPSSVHETLLLPCANELESNELMDMVQSINSTMPAEDVLSDSVYIYRIKYRYRICGKNAKAFRTRFLERGSFCICSVL